MSDECSQSLGFADLRPFFTIAHYGSGQIAPSFKRHLEACEACQKKWNFLERTDPQLADRYRRQVKVLIQRAEEFEKPIATPPEEISIGEVELSRADAPEMHPLISELWRSKPDFGRVKECWLAIRGISDLDERFRQSRELQKVAKSLLMHIKVQRERDPRRQSGQIPSAASESKFMQTLMDAYYEPYSPEDVRLPVNSVEDLLFIASLAFTSFQVREPIVEFSEPEQGQLSLAEFRRAQELFELGADVSREREPAGRW